MVRNFDSFITWLEDLSESLIRDGDDKISEDSVKLASDMYKDSKARMLELAEEWPDFYKYLIFTRTIYIDDHLTKSDLKNIKISYLCDIENSVDFLELVLLYDIRSSQMLSSSALLSAVEDFIHDSENTTFKGWLSNFDDKKPIRVEEKAEEKDKPGKQETEPDKVEETAKNNKATTSKESGTKFPKLPNFNSKNMPEYYHTIFQSDSEDYLNLNYERYSKALLQFPFLITNPPAELFCSVFKKEHLECLITANVFNKEILKINKLSFTDAWKYCDETIFIPQFDIRRAAYQNKYSTKSEFFLNSIKQILDERDKEKLQEKSHHSNIMENQLKSVLSKLKDIELNLISCGTAKPIVASDVPPFVPSSNIPPSTSDKKSLFYW